MSTRLALHLRQQELERTAQNRNIWLEHEVLQEIAADRCALLLCDVWDKHWSRGATERVDEIVPRLNAVVTSAREKGVHVLHAPSGTLDFYEDSPARRRMIEVPSAAPPDDIERADPPLPIDDTDHGSDTGEPEPSRAWARQHPGVEIDEDRDVISDSGPEVYSYLRQNSIERLLIAGVHTNMCVLHRTFGIKQMVRWGQPVALVRDLTDTMYNPAMPPYVSHEEGTRLVVEFIEKFWCPTIESRDLE